MNERTTIDERGRGPSALSATAALLAVAWMAVGCAHIDEEEREETAIVVPSAATSTPDYRGDGSIPENRSVIRMSDGNRDWEIEIPETDRGYQVEIPLREQRRVRAGHQSLTRADQELIDHLRRTDPDFERECNYAGGEHAVDREARRQRDDSSSTDESNESDESGESGESGDARDAQSDGDRPESAPAPTRPSYFRSIDDVQRLFEAGHYEQAMIHLADLEEAYPSDERIKSMKGTLWLELGREDLARDAWEQVLQINPDNESVQQALQRLEGDVDEESMDEEEQIEEFEDDQSE